MCSRSRLDNFSYASEQVFSNHLLVGLISNDLSTQDLLHASLVNWTWYRKFRYVLKLNKTREVSIKIDSAASRCRALKELNESMTNFFEEIHFNGIHQEYKVVKAGYRTSGPACMDCLINPNGNPVHLTEGEGSEVADLDKLYGNILAKIKFKYIRFETSLDVTCPFAQFMKRVVRDNASSVVEMQLKRSSNTSDYVQSCEYFLDTRNQKDDSIPVFPKLQILGIHKIGQRQPLIAPSLQTVEDFFYSTFIQSIVPSFRFFPFRTLVKFVLGFEASRTKGELEFFQCFKPNAQEVKISFPKGHESGSEELRLNVFKLGEICSASLISLWCPMSYFLAFTGIRISDSLLPNNTNIFLRLQELRLYGQMNTDILDGILSSVDGTTNAFPQLDKLYLNYSEGPGSTNEFKRKLRTPRAFPGVTFLHFNVQGAVSDLTVQVLKAFKQLRHLSLGFDLNALESFGYIVKGISHLKQLDEVSLFWNSVTRVNDVANHPNQNCMNDDETHHVSAVKLGDASPISTFFTCVLQQKGIHRLNFGSDHQPGCDLEIMNEFLTQRNAVWIREMNPKLILHLEVIVATTPTQDYLAGPECLDDLKNCIKIKKFLSVANEDKTKVLRTWDLAFIEMDNEDPNVGAWNDRLVFDDAGASQ